MIGFVDVGGGTRGIFGAGVFDYCIDHGIECDYFIGVSAGAANGVSFIGGQRGRNYVYYNDYAFRKEYMSKRNFIKTYQDPFPLHEVHVACRCSIDTNR